MKVTYLAALALTTPLFLANPVKAENPSHVQQLLSTGECMGCNRAARS